MSDKERFPTSSTTDCFSGGPVGVFLEGASYYPKWDRWSGNPLYYEEAPPKNCVPDELLCWKCNYCDREYYNMERPPDTCENKCGGSNYTPFRAKVEDRSDV